MRATPPTDTLIYSKNIRKCGNDNAFHNWHLIG